MKTINLDFNRILSTNEILNISEENYNNIIKYVTLQTGKFDKKYNAKFYSLYKSIYETLSEDERANLNTYVYTEDKDKIIEYTKNSKHMLIRDLTAKERELIICNYFILNDDLFINVLEKTIEVSGYNNINELYNEINYLCELRDKNPKKFNFLLSRIKLEEKLISIIKKFIELYNISDINIILNKLNYLVAKNKYSFESSVQKTKK